MALLTGRHISVKVMKMSLICVMVWEQPESIIHRWWSLLSVVLVAELIERLILFANMTMPLSIGAPSILRSV